MTGKPNPFVGPRSFETGEKLYGRDRELRSLSALLIAERIVLMHSPSGAGKTSLLKAGLLPRMRDEQFNVLPVARVNIEPPPGTSSANRYLLSTLISLEEGFPEPERLPVAELASLSLDQYLLKRGPENNTLLVLDQFEEVLTTFSSDRAGKLDFFNQLGDALRNKNRWALFSMREDYLGMLAPYIRPIPDRLVTRFRLDLLGVDAAIQAMQMPARDAGVTFNLATASKLADDLRRIQVQLPDGTTEAQLGPYVEPVQLQVVCYRLWENLSSDDRQIDEEDLSLVGDVNQSLSDYYTQSVIKVAESSGAPERSIREWFERKLITPEGLRGQVRLGAELSEGLPNAAARQLVDAHIVRSDQRGGQTWMELAHDRLVEPVRTSNRDWFSQNLSLFQRQAEIWLEKGRSEGLLLRGHELEQVEKEIAGQQLRPDEEAFLNACRLQRRRAKREKYLRRGITAGLVAALIMGAVAVNFWIQAKNANDDFIRAANQAQAESTRAFQQQSTAEVASTNAIAQQAAAQAASTQAIAQQATAQAASTQAFANANAAATAQAQSEAERARAEAEKARALEQEKIAENEKKQAQASALVAQSLLLQLRTRDDLANLMAVEAYHFSDTTRTRTQLVAPVYTRGQLPLAQNNTTGLVPSMAFLPDGSGMVSASFYNCDVDNFLGCDSGVVKFWTIDRETRSGNNLPNALRQNNNTINPQGIIDAIALSPDGKTLAVSSCDPVNTNTLRCEKEDVTFWDVATRAAALQPLSVKLDIANDKAVQLSFSPDGKTLLLALNVPTIFNSSPATKPYVILFDLAASSEIMRFTPELGLYQAAFSPDSKTLALAGGQTVTLLDLASQQFTELAAAKSPRKLFSLAYSPDGKYLAFGLEDGSIRLVDLSTSTAVDTPLKHISRPLSLVFSPDSKILAAGYQDAGLLFWDVGSRQRLLTSPIYKHIEAPDRFPILSLAFSPDGKQLASASNEAILWDLNPDSWAVKACNIAGRNFTKAEWRLYFLDEPYRVTCPQFPEGRDGT